MPPTGNVNFDKTLHAEPHVPLLVIIKIGVTNAITKNQQRHSDIGDNLEEV
jgi:hypothetical protein